MTLDEPWREHQASAAQHIGQAVTAGRRGAARGGDGRGGALARSHTAKVDEGLAQEPVDVGLRTSPEITRLR